MIERFDHAVIAVPDLETGMDAFRRLGFEVAVGGRHPSLGTRNAIVRFGLDYLELLTVEDPATARSRGPFGQELLAYLWEDSGLVGYVLAGTGLEDEVDGLKGLGLDVEGPFEMDRLHPRGARLEWKLVLPGGSPWRKPWPYLIDWITAEDELLAWDPPGSHDCRVTGVARDRPGGGRPGSGGTDLRTGVRAPSRARRTSVAGCQEPSLPVRAVRIGGSPAHRERSRIRRPEPAGAGALPIVPVLGRHGRHDPRVVTQRSPVPRVAFGYRHRTC